jgi:hypothetical protein
MIPVEPFDADVAGLEKELGAGCRARLHEILGHFGLTVHGHGASRETLEVDSKRAIGKSQCEAVVDQAFAQQALTDIRFDQEIHGALFEDSCTNPPFDVFARLPLEHHVVDTVTVQEL